MEVGIYFSWDIGIWDPILECDSKIVSNAPMRLCSPPVTISNTYEGIAQKVHGFSLVKVSHVKWQGNRLARILANIRHGKICQNLLTQSHPKNIRPKPKIFFTQSKYRLTRDRIRLDPQHKTFF